MKNYTASGRYRRIMQIMMFLGVLLFLGAAPARVEAAFAYKELFPGMNQTKTVKSGQYYFKAVNYTQVYMAKGKNGAYKATPISLYSFVNDRQAFYVKSNALYKYVFAAGKEQKLKTLPTGVEQGYTVSAVQGQKVYLNMGSFPKWRYVLYSYHTGTRKLKKEMDDCSILCRYGNYVVAQKEYRTDVSPYTLTIYKLGSSGLKKVKTLTSRGFNPVFIGSRLYYASYSGKYMNKVTLYSCNAKGGSSKKLGVFETKDQYGSVVVTQITAKKCRINISGVNYEYTYKTKKTKKVA